MEDSHCLCAMNMAFLRCVSITSLLFLPLVSVHADDYVSQSIEALMRNDEASIQQTSNLMSSPDLERFELNVLVLDLSWDESRPSLRKEIVRAARDLQRYCDDTRIESLSLCGQAHFALAYVQGIEGKMILSSANARKSINMLEEVILQDPHRMDERLYLGLLYYYTENLPAFVRSVGRAFRLVPKTPAGAGKPMIESVASSDSDLRGPATFIWADLLAQGGPEDRHQAIEIFDRLMAEYPDNFRFYFNKVETQIADKRYWDAKMTLESRSVEGSEKGLVHLLQMATSMGIGEFIAAAEHAQRAREYKLPEWSLNYLNQLESELARQELTEHERLPVVAGYRVTDSE